MTILSSKWIRVQIPVFIEFLIKSSFDESPLVLNLLLGGITLYFVNNRARKEDF